MTSLAAPLAVAMFLAREPPRTEWVTSPTAAHRGASPRRTLWDFDDFWVTLAATTPEPRVDPGEPREARDLDRALDERRDLLRRCYRWARFHDRDLASARVVVSLQVDVWGRAVEVAAGGPSDELDRCVVASLRGLELDRYTPRATWASGEIAFAPSSLGRPHQAPLRPRTPRVRSMIPAVTMRQPTVLPHDALRFSLLSIDDYDAAQAQREESARYRQAMAAWRAGRAPRPARPVTTIVVAASTVMMCSFEGPVALRKEIDRHLSALGRCYRAAWERQPGLEDRVVVRVAISAAGHPLGPPTLGKSLDDDPALESCVLGAMTELRLPVVPWSQGIRELSIPIHFSPGEDAAEPPSPPSTRCEAEAGGLRALSSASRRVDEEVVARARSLAETAARDARCTDDAADRVRELAVGAHKDGQRRSRSAPLERAIDLYRIYLRLRPFDTTMRFYLAEALFKLERYTEATPQYLLVATLSPWGKWTSEALYAARVACSRTLHFDDAT